MDDLREVYQMRRTRLANEMKTIGVSALVLIDSETHRDKSIRYFTGYALDATLIIFSDGTETLAVWDEILGRRTSFTKRLRSYREFGGDNNKMISTILDEHFTERTDKLVELPPYITLGEFATLKRALKGYRLKCFRSSAFRATKKGTNTGAFERILRMRMVKDSYEIMLIRRAASVTNFIISEIEKGVSSGEIRTEIDVSLKIERLLREENCESVGFETLAAGSGRSFSIHAFPPYTRGNWGTQGLSILDFGVVFEGYTSDVTLTVAREPLTQEQKNLVSLVEKAYNECLPLYRAKEKIALAARKAREVFETSGRNMPHTLGHALGLNVHENPRISEKCTLSFESGMVLTLEPGLYDEKFGGARWENDVLILGENDTEPNEVLTCSRIIHI